MKNVQLYHYSLNRFIDNIKDTYDVTEELFVLEGSAIIGICINSDLYIVSDSIKVDPVLASNKDNVPIYNFYINESKIEVLYNSEISLLVEIDDNVLSSLIKG